MVSCESFQGWKTFLLRFILFGSFEVASIIVAAQFRRYWRYSWREELCEKVSHEFEKITLQKNYLLECCKTSTGYFWRMSAIWFLRFHLYPIVSIWNMDVRLKNLNKIPAREEMKTLFFIESLKSSERHQFKKTKIIEWFCLHPLHFEKIVKKTVTIKLWLNRGVWVSIAQIIFWTS